jgi:hypothetical protein
LHNQDANVDAKLDFILKHPVWSFGADLESKVFRKFESGKDNFPPDGLSPYITFLSNILGLIHHQNLLIESIKLFLSKIHVSNVNESKIIVSETYTEL